MDHAAPRPCLQPLESRRHFAGSPYGLTAFEAAAGPASSYPAEAVRVGSRWYASIGTAGAADAPRGLWVGGFAADGTYQAPTNLLPPAAGQSVYALTPFDGRLAFGRGQRLMLASTDGALATAVGPTFPSGVASLTPVVRIGQVPLLYFTAGTTASDVELWRTDGTDAGTVRVSDVRPGVVGSMPTFVTPTADGRVFFSADDGVVGRELWVTDGTSGGTRLVKDLRAGAQASVFNGIFAVGPGKVAIGVGGALYTSDGVAANTAIVETTYRGYATKVWPVAGGVAYYNTLGGDATFLFYDGTNAPRDLGRLNVAVGGYSGTADSNGGTLYHFAGDTTTARRGVYAIDAGGIRFVGGNDQVRFIEASGTGVFVGRLRAAGGPLDVEYIAAGQPTPDLVTTRAEANLVLPLLADGPRLLLTFDDARIGRELWSAAPDSTPPTVVTARLDADAKPHALRLTLSEPSVNQSWTVGFALSVRRAADGVTLAPGSFTLEVNAGGVLTYAANPSFIADGLLPDGVYEATLAGGTLRDAAGNVNATPYTFTFHVLRGDLDGDRRVGFSDLVALAQNYGVTGRSYSQGNVDYSADGSVGFADLVLLAQRYGASLPSTDSARAAATDGTAGNRRRRGERDPIAIV